jgi:gamma-glutamyltranspeptidase/glutathione hydrolase
MMDRCRKSCPRSAGTPFTRILSVILIFLLTTIPLTAGGSKGPVKARNGMVVTSHRIASEVGVEILRKGGNAVDAAIAVGFALAVTLPAAGNLGGGGFMVVRTTEGEVTAFNFREMAPATAHEEMFLDENGEYSETAHHASHLAVGVPGTVAGFFLAHERFGKLPMKELLAPAVKLAEEGFPVTSYLSSQLARYSGDFQKFPASAKKFLKEGGEPYQPGELWRQPDLAKTLLRIQTEGRDGFYRGETARLIAEEMKRNGGLITKEDLANYEAQERKPIHGTYRGYDIYGMPPPSSGGIAVTEMLNILEGYNLREAGFGSAQYLHLLAETMRRAFADRAKHVGDPDFNPELPVERLTSKEYARTLRGSIDPAKASVSDPATFNEAYESDQTTHYSVIDALGNAVVVTYTLEASFGSKIVAEGTGILLNNEMGDFNPVPCLTDETGKVGTPPNLVRPRKRMISSMTPTIVAKDGKPFLLVGSPGGRTIINTVLQIILNVVDFDMDVAEAVAAPRIHHQWLPDRLRMERFGFSPDTVKLLEAMGHTLDTRSSRSQGRAMVIQIDPESGLLLGAADPRSGDSAAVGY